jgi:hypothetical protein
VPGLRRGPGRRRHRQDQERQGETTDRHKIGRARELEIAVILQQLGLIDDYWQPPRAQYRKGDDGGQDIFGYWDIVAFKEEWPAIFIQIKKARWPDDNVDMIRFVQGMRPAAHFWHVTYDTDKKGQLKMFELKYLGWNDQRWYLGHKWTRPTT